MKKIPIILFVLLLMFLLPGSALAQNYYFQLPQKTVNAYWNADGTESLDYVYVFNNDSSGHVIDYVDVGIPNSHFDQSSITADVNGKPLTDISSSGFQGIGGVGVAVGLGQYAIPPGGSGTVHVFIAKVSDVLYRDDKDNQYVSADLAPNYFESSVCYGSTATTVIFHLPPGIKPEEPRWHAAPSGFTSQPETSLDDQGRVTYAWTNASASCSTAYTFGASFPATYVPDTAIVKPNPFAWLENINFDSLFNNFFWLCCIGGLILMVVAGSAGNKNRKLQYLPPKISIEGHGIKRGLTAVEAGILLEQPLDKVMTMILFGVIKKNAAAVTTRDPLALNITDPQPPDLRDYEVDFLEAFKLAAGPRKAALQKMIVTLVKSVGEKMKGFSLKETIEYYKGITDRAWAEVSAANTPEVKSAKFDEVMEWSMLDKKYEDRTRDVFSNQPVFVPIWWGRFDPGYGHVSSAHTASIPSLPTSGRSSAPSMPNLPGSAFAASMVNGVQTFSSKVVGDISTFTSGITNVTNPPPPPSTSTYHSSGGGGHSCACACACAGCACACAGGGR